MKDVTPLSKSPAVLVDGKLLYESGAIITELLAQFPSPNVEATSSPQSTFWGYFSEGSVMLFFQPQMFLGMGAKVTKKGLSPEEAKGADALQGWFNNWSTGHVKLAMDEAERYLGDNQWFSGGDKLGLGDVRCVATTLTPVHDAHACQRGAWHQAQARAEYPGVAGPCAEPSGVPPRHEPHGRRGGEAGGQGQAVGGGYWVGYWVFRSIVLLV